MNIIQNNYHWLHGRWPDRAVEKQPLVNTDGTTNIKGTYIVDSVSGYAAAIENFTNKKPIYTYPTDMTPEGDLHFIEIKNV